MLHVIKKNIVCSLPVAMLMLGMTTAKADIVSTIEAAASGTTVNCSGTYSGLSTCNVPSGVTVKGPATFIFKSSSSTGINIASGKSGVTIQSITVEGAYHGIEVDGSSNHITSCVATKNWNTGIQCENSGSSSNTISGCTSYNNADTSGGNADGFGVKQSTGANITVSNCTAYGNSDDGFDFEKSKNPVTCSNCLSYTEGSAVGGTGGTRKGNGCGFKMGIKGDSVKHIMNSDVAHNNTGGDTASGFDTNDNSGGVHLTSCHSYSNKNTDRLQNCTLTNCTMET
jgi:hypothetical protein